MYSVWPPSVDGGEPVAVTDAELERLYGYPEGVTRPWVQANFVTSADGAVAVHDRSDGLSHPADKRIFSLGRDLADVVLVGAGTAKAEKYRGVKARARRTERRQRLGRASVPPVAVVSGRCSISPDSPLLAGTTTPPIVITTHGAPAARRAELAEAGADVIVAGMDRVALDAALHALAERGLPRINCEGGPRLFAALVAEDLVDQLCLTIAPLLAGAGAGRIALGLPAEGIRAMTLASVLYEDGFCMLRYRRSQNT